MIHVCTTCGTSYERAAAPPAHCAICTDERRHVLRSGQKWTDREQIPSGTATIGANILPDS